MPSSFDMGPIDIAWCPGCGNFPINNLMKQALEELGLKPEQVALTSGIGQAGKAPQYLKCNFFNGLHGRALPLATAIKAANPELTVITETGAGDMYGEGGNHYIHAIRRNPNITTLVHNNMVYGLTKGQASPTSEKGMVTPVQVNGVYLEPFNPISTAIALDCSFVARANCGDLQQTKEIIKKAIQHKGFAIVDLFQPCPVFNKINTYQWFKENTYYLEEGYDVHNRAAAFARSIEKGKLPLGIFYIRDDKKTFEENLNLITPLYTHKPNFKNIKEYLEMKKLSIKNLHLRTYS